MSANSVCRLAFEFKLSTARTLQWVAYSCRIVTARRAIAWFDVVARAGVEFAIGMLGPMVAKLEKTPQMCRNAARDECVRLANAISERWPNDHPHAYEPKTDRSRTLSIFPKLLMEIDDSESASRFLRGAARKDRSLDLDKLVVVFCRKHGCAKFADELIALFETNEGGVCVRDLNWLDQLGCVRLDDPARGALIGKLARLAILSLAPPTPYIVVGEERECSGDDKYRLSFTLHTSSVP